MKHFLLLISEKIWVFIFVVRLFFKFLIFPLSRYAYEFHEAAFLHAVIQQLQSSMEVVDKQIQAVLKSSMTHSHS